MRQIGFNVVRIYHVPPRWFLDRCAAAGMRVLDHIAMGEACRVSDGSEERVTRSQMPFGSAVAIPTRSSCDFRLSCRKRDLQHHGALARCAPRNGICRGIRFVSGGQLIRTSLFSYASLSSDRISSAAEQRFYLFQRLPAQSAGLRALLAAAAKSGRRSAADSRRIRHGHDPALPGGAGRNAWLARR